MRNLRVRASDWPCPARSERSMHTTVVMDFRISERRGASEYRRNMAL